MPLKSEISLGNIDKIKDPKYKKFLNQFQEKVDKIKDEVEDLDRRYKHEIRLYSYFYNHGYLSANEKQTAETYLAVYQDHRFKYETDFKYFDYKIAHKKHKIKQRLEEMEEDFNESLE
jgi:predicted transcriptional regulator